MMTDYHYRLVTRNGVDTKTHFHLQLLTRIGDDNHIITARIINLQ